MSFDHQLAIIAMTIQPHLIPLYLVDIEIQG
jgi:hypothetical protein